MCLESDCSQRAQPCSHSGLNAPCSIKELAEKHRLDEWSYTSRRAQWHGGRPRACRATRCAPFRPPTLRHRVKCQAALPWLQCTKQVLQYSCSCMGVSSPQVEDDVAPTAACLPRATANRSRTVGRAVSSVASDVSETIPDAQHDARLSLGYCLMITLLTVFMATGTSASRQT